MRGKAAVSNLRTKQKGPCALRSRAKGSNRASWGACCLSARLPAAKPDSAPGSTWLQVCA